MRKLIFLYIALVIAVYAGLHIQKDPGYVLFAIDKWTIEMPLWFFIVSLIILLSLLHIVLNFLHSVASLSYRYKRFISKWKNKTSKSKTKQGLIAFGEGKWSIAESLLIKGITSSDSPLINYLTAAKAAQEQSKTKQRDKYLREAEKTMPDTKIAILLTQAELQLRSKQYEQAHATLSHLLSNTPSHSYALKLMLTLCLEVKDWHELASLLPKLKK